jgi:hypothetical protein
MKGKNMMVCIEILALCGIAQMLTDSWLGMLLRALIPTKFHRYTIADIQVIGFWLGLTAYTAVALCAGVPETAFPFPPAEIVAETSDCVQWIWVLSLAGLISISTILVDQFVDWLYHCKKWFRSDLDNHRLAEKIVNRKLSQPARKRDFVSMAIEG